MSHCEERSDEANPVLSKAAGSQAKRKEKTVKKTLVAFFSHSGNTREIAEMIHDIAGGDIFEIKTVKTYPGDYDAVVAEAKQELKTGFKPELSVKIGDFSQYNTIFIGYPDWWGTFPAPVRTFLTEYDLSGKTVMPFCTHEGSGMGRSVADISKLCPKSILPEGIAIRGSDAKTAKNKVDEWLRKINVINTK
jgi:flavodoxin